MPAVLPPLVSEDVLLETETTLSVLSSMYPSPELVLPPAADSLSTLTDLPSELRGVLTLVLDGGEELLVDLILGLREGSEGQTLVVRQPSWLSNAQFRTLHESRPDAQGGEAFADDVLGLTDWVREAVPRILQEAREAEELERERKKASSAGAEVEGDEVGMDRVWFWLPSLSTKEKRNDIVNVAPTWNLTGFVLAGKPGIICLEGTKRNADNFMNWIKAVSWGDVPSFQKKVTERHRSSPISTRLFTGMVEITDLISFGGHRGNRGEMGDVRKWIEERGVESDVLGKVLNLGGA